MNVPLVAYSNIYEEKSKELRNGEFRTLTNYKINKIRRTSLSSKETRSTRSQGTHEKGQTFIKADLSSERKQFSEMFGGTLLF